MRFNCYEEAARRVAELESLLTAKGNKAIKKAMLPQPLPKGEFYTYNALTLMFQKLLEIHDAQGKCDAAIDFTTQYWKEDKRDMTPLYKPLGELIIMAVTYLERSGCDADKRMLLFSKLNHREDD